MALTQPPVRVYIADNDLVVAESIQFLLKTEHIESTIFSGGRGLLERAMVSPPDCVVTEAELPDIRGVDLLRGLRRGGLQMPVIILANHSEVQLTVEAVKLGAWDYFEKPFLQRVLLDSVKRALASQCSGTHKH